MSVVPIIIYLCGISNYARLMIIRCLIGRPRTILFGLIFAASLSYATAQEKKDTLSTAQPVPNISKVEQTPLLSVDHPVLPASFHNPRPLQGIRDRHLSDALLNGLKPHRSSLRLNDELDFTAERRDFVSPLLQTRHAAGVFSWRPTDRMRFYTSGNIGLGHDLLTGVRKDFGWNAGADFLLSQNLTAHIQGGWQQNFGFMPMRTVCGQFRWQATDRLSFTTGVDYRQVQWNAFDNRTLSLGGTARYELIDNVFINGFGTYPLYSSTRSGLNMAVPMHGFGPQYGGSIELKVSERFGFAVGAEREYNIWTRRWETHYFAYPVFYGDKK
ncbi:hypothetical protein HR13_04955 [Porphyromonas gulae]|nr:hypothetical protein HQ49_06175 [Porphyromonas gulae]KGN80117.1 hypothetical protein HR13_04955 [Porphyromonas gulae]